MRSTFKVLFYVKKGSEKPNGNLPLMCRITVDGEIKQFSCKMDVPPRLWDVKNNRASGKSVEAQRINLAVDKIRVEVNRRYQELMQTDGYVTAAKLKDAYLGIGVKQETLLISSVTAATMSYIFTGTEAMFKFSQTEAFEIERIPYVLLLGVFLFL